jgi:hypothetical protein
MKHGIARVIAAALLVVAIVSLSASSHGLRSVGLRLILPFTEVPFSIGAEVVMDAPFGRLSISLLLSPAGGSLLLGSADVALTDDPDAAKTFLRMTTGLSYFDPTRYLPTLLFGGGVLVLCTVTESFGFSLTGEVIYPFAFPEPMLALSGGWMLP